MIRIGLSAITGRGRRWSLPVSTLAVAILATFSPCLAEDWEISFVDGPKWFDSMRDRSLCIDRQGHPHVIYWHAGGYAALQLWYAWSDGNAWHTELVDGSESPKYAAALAVDTLGIPHVIYGAARSGGNDSELRYATRSPSGWQTHVLDYGPHWTVPCIAIDGLNQVNVCYRSLDSSTRLLYGYRTTWYRSEV